MKNNNSKFNEFIRYNNAFLNYEQYKQKFFAKTRVTNKFIDCQGYLINLDDINNIKQNIKHEDFIKENTNNEEKMRSIFDENLFDKIKKVSQIKYKTSDYLKNMLLNGNKYILINQGLWNDIYEKNIQDNEGPIIFEINKNKIVLSLKNEQLTLSHRDFIFDFYSCGGDNSFSEIQKIFDSIYNYCIFENNFLKYLESNSNHSDKGYLIKKIWIDEWKKYSNYEEIKNNYFIENNPVFFEQKKKEIINDIIDYREKNKNIYKFPMPCEIINVNKKKEFEIIINKDSLAIINQDFKNLFSFKNNDNSFIIKYDLINNQIRIILDQIIIFKSDNNIILVKNNNELSDLKLLIKIFFFQTKLKKIINSDYKNNLNNENNNQIIIINKKIIENYKNFFEYQKLFNLLKDNKIINNEQLELDDTILSHIISQISVDYIDIIKEKEGSFMLDIKEEDKKFKINSIRTYFLGLWKVEYITEFEIVNQDIVDLLIEKNILTKNEIIYGKYAITDKKIVISFDYENKNFVEIGYLNSDGDFIIEYIIKENNHSYNDELLYNLDKYGIEECFGLKYIDNKNNEISIDGKIFGYYYEIKKDISMINNYLQNNDKIKTITKMENNEFINGIISIIISIFLFTNDIKKKIRKSKKNDNNTERASILKCILLMQIFLMNLKY